MGTEQPVVSVVLACRNEERWIRDAVDSVLGQTFTDLELLVVDDGSTDQTAEIVRSYRDPRLQLIQQPPLGACAARNRGLSVARGRLLQILDGDDCMAPDKLQQQVARWRELGDDFVYFGPYGRFNRSIAAARFQPESNWCDMSGHQWLVAAWTDGAMMAPHSWLVPAALARRAGPWDESLLQNQDGEYFARVLLASSGVRFCPEARSYYRIATKDSVSRRTDHAARASRWKALQSIGLRLRQIDDSAATRAACGNAFEEFMFTAYPQYPDLYEQARTALEAVGQSKGNQPLRGPLFKACARLVGWRKARSLQHGWYLLRRNAAQRLARGLMHTTPLLALAADLAPAGA